MKEWIESIKSLKKRADKEFYEGDYVDLCILGRKMMEHLLILKENLDVQLEIDEIRDFFSRYQGEEDMFKPYLANIWGGIPTEDEGELCMEFINRIMSIIEELENH